MFARRGLLVVLLAFGLTNCGSPISRVPPGTFEMAARQLPPIEKRSIRRLPSGHHWPAAKTAVSQSSISKNYETPLLQPVSSAGRADLITNAPKPIVTSEWIHQKAEEWEREKVDGERREREIKRVINSICRGC
jgi:hypothetical protein